MLKLRCFLLYVLLIACDSIISRLCLEYSPGFPFVTKLTSSRNNLKFMVCAHTVARLRNSGFIGSYLNLNFPLKTRNLQRFSTMASSCKLDAGVASAKIVSDPATFVLQRNPAFIAHRNSLFEELYKKQQDSLKELETNDITIKFEVKEGEVLTLSGKAFQTSPYDLISSVDKKRAKKTIVAQVKYESDSGVKDLLIDVDEHDEEADSEWTLWDMTRPLEGSCHVRVHDFDSKLGKHVYWHSSAHMLGSALETFYGAFLTIGPALSSGFYYDCFMGTNTLKPEDVKGMITHVDKMSISNKPFERLICTKEEALQLMSYNPFKVDLIKRKIADGEKTVCYRCGDFVDLCRGPHVPFTSFIKGASFDILKASSCYWLSNSDSDSLQRVYGISFPEKDQLKSYHARIEEAKQRDHRIIGTQLNLFYFDAIHSPGSCFWLPNGAKIYNRLTTFLRDNYRLRGYQEVVTPNIYSCDLWKQSGHYENYKENMYTFMSDDTEWGMKPMNCPGHCLMFKHMNLSYRQLPLRLADFGVLHRNELTGSLSGLTRVRRFQQDDAHIFCTQDQIMDEVLDLIKFIGKVYSLFNFRYEFKLSTKPVKALGDDKLWEVAEASLTEALNRSGHKWVLNPGDGAFYGPKIDIVLFDCLDREHQCGTIQLDFNLPIRFNLEYRDKSFDETAVVTEKSETGLRNGFSRPVIIHRAILGSIERFIAIVLEQTKGKLPFWLSPTQVLIIPISDKHLEYADFVYNTLLRNGYNVEVDKTTNTMNKKIKFGQQQRWNYMAIVGDREREDKTVSLRPLDTDAQQVMTIDELLKLLEGHNISVV